MNININYPAQTKSVKIENIKIILGTKKAMVETWNDGYTNAVEVDLQTFIDDATTTQLKTIKGFLSKIIAAAVDIALIDVPDTIFKIEE